MTGGEPESISWLRVLLAFFVVFGMIAGLGYVLRRFGGKTMRLPGMATQNSKRLELIESLPLDMRRRLVIVRCDGEEHLLLLGANQDIVVQPSLKKNQNS